MLESTRIDVKKLRQSLGISQQEFASRFGFNVGTLRCWERGRSYPDKAARALLIVISYSPNTVRDAIVVMAVKLRKSLQMSQPEFASRFGFNLRTLRQWEQGRRCPDDAARALLAVISHAPEVVKEALSAAS